MGKAKVTSKCQITIPADIRRELGLRPGDVLEFIKDKEGIRVKKQAGENPFEKWVGSIKDFPWKSTDEFIEAIRGPFEDDAQPRS